MEDFFDGADVFKATTSATPTAAQGVPAEALLPSTKLVSIDEGTHTERVSEIALIPAKTLTPKDRVIPPVAAQIKVASPATPLVISTSDSFEALSQDVKDGSSLVVTPSSIPCSATRGPNADLSSEGYEDVLENPDDELIMKKRIFDSDEEESADHEAEFMGMYLPYLVKFPFFFFKFLSLPSSFFSSLYIYILYLYNPLMWFPFTLHVCSSNCRDF